MLGASSLVVSNEATKQSSGIGFLAFGLQNFPQVLGIYPHSFFRNVFTIFLGTIWSSSLQLR